MKKLNRETTENSLSVKQILKQIPKEIGASLKTRDFRVGGYSIMAVVLMAAIVVMANVLVNALPAKYTQFDVTSSQLYSVSELTESIVSAVDQEVTIYWVVRSGNEDTTILPLLEKYEGMSDKITVVQKDPDVYPTFVRQYTDGNVYENSMIVESEERYRYVPYDDMYEYDYTNYYTDGTYDVYFNGEEALTSAIDYVVSDNIPKMYTLTGHGESDLPSDIQEEIEDGNIELGELSLLTVEAVPEDAEAILIYNPQSDISSSEKDRLLTWLQAGGKLILLTSPLESGDSLPNLAELMEYYGVSAAQGVVLEKDQNYYLYGYPYYLLPEIGSHTITSPLTSGNYYVMCYITQGLTVSGELRDGLEIDELLTTSDSAFSKIAGYGLSTFDKEEGDIDGPFSLAVAITETVGEEETQIIWISNGSLLEMQDQMGTGNKSFFMNCVNWLCEKEDSISIVSKSLDYNYLGIDTATASTGSMLVVGLIPLSYLTVGGYIWMKRRRR